MMGGKTNMMQSLIKLRRLNLGKEKKLILTILAISTLLVTSLFSTFILNTISVQAQPTDTNQILGDINLIGQVDVNNLPEASGTASNNRIPPVHYIDPQTFARGKALAESPGFVPPGQSAKVIVSPSTAPLTVSSNLILDGVSGNGLNPCLCSPPDANVGVGPNHVFEMVNLAGIIYYKNGKLAKNTFALSKFFGLPTSSMSDPQILFDNGSGRWFASILDMSSNSVRFAVSKSIDPTGAWILYAAPFSYFPDQPFIGASEDKFVISANDFVPSGTWPYAGVQYWIINKTDLVNAASTIHGYLSLPDLTMFSLHPAQHLTSTPVFYMITNCLSECVSDPASTTSNASLVAISGVPGVSTFTITPNEFPINTMSNPPGALQPGTSTTLNTNDNRVLSAVWENNNLWFSANDACIPSGDSTTRSCARLIQISTLPTLPISTVIDFDYASSGQYVFYPAVSLYQGTLVVVYGQSSSTVYPSLLFTGKTPSGTLQTPLILKRGTANDLSGRYGDYFGAATDPSAISTFWVAGEYRKTSGFQSWNTAIARVAVG
jgi:hypothetical protein